MSTRAQVIGEIRSILGQAGAGTGTLWVTKTLAKVDQVVTHDIDESVWSRIKGEVSEILRGWERQHILDNWAVGTPPTPYHLRHHGAVGRLKDLVGIAGCITAYAPCSTRDDWPHISMNTIMGTAQHARHTILKEVCAEAQTDLIRRGEMNESFDTYFEGMTDAHGVPIMDRIKTGDVDKSAVPEVAKGTRLGVHKLSEVDAQLVGAGLDADDAVPVWGADLVTYPCVLLPPPPDDIVFFWAQELAAMKGGTLLVAAEPLDDPDAFEERIEVTLWRVEVPSASDPNASFQVRYIMAAGEGAGRVHDVFREMRARNVAKLGTVELESGDDSKAEAIERIRAEDRFGEIDLLSATFIWFSKTRKLEELT